MKIRITLTEEMLGTSSNSPDIHREFIASKAPDAHSIEEEVAAVGVDKVENKSMTVFPRTEKGELFLWNYQIKGFLKDACGMLSRSEDTEAGKVTAFRKIIDGLIFPEPRKILINPPKGEKEVAVGKCVRPLRANTPQGERVSLAASETVPTGCWFDVEFKLFELRTDKKNATTLPVLLKELLDYGQYRGLLQWRNSGKGTFTWEEIK